MFKTCPAALRFGTKRAVQLQLCRQLPPRRRVPHPEEFAPPPIFQSAARPFIVEPTMAGNEEDMHHMRGGSRQQQLIVEPTMEEFAFSAPARPKPRSRNAPASSPPPSLENVSDPIGLGILFRRDSRNQLKVTALFPGSDADTTGLIGIGDILYVQLQRSDFCNVRLKAYLLQVCRQQNQCLAMERQQG